MKRTRFLCCVLPTHAAACIIRCTLIMTILTSGLLATSCIYDSPAGDDLYRTLWKSDEVPLGPFDVSSLTLEFLCNGGVSVSLDNGLKIYGTYYADGSNATLHNLAAHFGSDWALTSESDSEDGSDITITFIEAHRSGDTLFLLWRVQNAIYPFTTALHRLSEYE